MNLLIDMECVLIVAPFVQEVWVAPGEDPYRVIQDLQSERNPLESLGQD